MVDYTGLHTRKYSHLVGHCSGRSECSKKPERVHGSEGRGTGSRVGTIWVCAKEERLHRDHSRVQWLKLKKIVIGALQLVFFTGEHTSASRGSFEAVRLDKSRRRGGHVARCEESDRRVYLVSDSVYAGFIHITLHL